MSQTTTAEILRAHLGEKLLCNIPLAPLSTFAVGGSASYYCEAYSQKDVQDCIAAAKYAGVATFILAGGSNIVVADEGIDKLVIHLLSQNYGINDNVLQADAGVSLSDLVTASITAGREGIIWASGIPGSFGGAIRGNAGAYGGEISDTLLDVTVLQGGSVVTLPKNVISFSYRESQFKQSSDIILSARIALGKEANAEALQKASNDIIALRNTKHPKLPCAGSYFKNVVINEHNRKTLADLGIPQECWGRAKVPTAWLIDRCNLKGTKIGGAQISPMHANIIVNTGNAKAADILALAALMKQRVWETCGIAIEEEVGFVR